MDRPPAINLENIPRRTPVLTELTAKKFPDQVIDQQWKFMTEALKRELQADHKTRGAIIPFVSSPVTETLPNAAVKTATTVNDRINKLEHRLHGELGEYLTLPAVPDELITPDIANAPGHSSPEEVFAMYSQWPNGVEMFQKNVANSKEFLHGITSQERGMITRRYRMARDTKLLALAGEMIEQGPIIVNQQGEATLPSGTKIFVSPTKEADYNVLLNPLNWEKRRMIKDRVYEISVGGKSYILKEKKTARHTDTKRHGHQEGLSSANEFTTAALFRERAAGTQDGIQISWEDPIGYVVFPDGFQCTVFEFEKNLIGHNDVIPILTDQIIQHKEQFEQEYQRVAKQAAKLYRHKATYIYDDSGKMFSFEAFARVKAMYWTDKTIHMLGDTVTSNNFGNSDIDGYAFRIKSSPALGLEIVGMDFEYFYPINRAVALEWLQNSKDFRDEHILRNGLFRSQWWDERPVTKIEQAAYIGMYLIDKERV